MTEDAPVLIAGGGLVGLSTAMFLAQHGVSSIAIERLTKPSTLPRAAFFHMRTFELFRQAGLEDQVRTQSQKEFTPDGAIVAVESLAGKELAAFIPSLNEGVEALSPCRRWFVSQPGLEPILRRRAQEVGATVINGQEVVSAVQDSEGVTVTLRDVETGAEKQMRTSSTIRSGETSAAALAAWTGSFKGSPTVETTRNPRWESFSSRKNPVISGLFT